MLVELTCQECGKCYSVKPYRKAKSRFCSYKCSGTYRARETLNVGPKLYMIGNKFRVGKPPANAGQPAPKGKDSPSWVEGIERTCEHCGTKFHQKPWRARQNGPARFCSRTCFETSGVFTAEKSRCYVGGITTYRGKGWLEVRAQVIAEQAGCCAHCDKHVGKSLPVHHIAPFRAFDTAEAANARSNLVGLCQSCHMKAERASR